MIDVFLAEMGCYEDRYVSGVYASLEAAMADNPIPPEPRRVVRAGGWQPDRYSEDVWHNGLDWEQACSITRYEVKS